jgi:predicted acyl esterase
MQPENYNKATQFVYHTPGEQSYIELPVVRAE